ncbi:hypothetical protein PRIC2_001208 [Phytophthora ramorum]
MDPDALLTSVRVVCHVNPHVQALDHVLQLLDEFLFPWSRLTLPCCVQHRSERLFSRVLRSTDAARCQFAKWRQFRLAMCRAAQLGQLWMMQQLYERHPKALNGATALAAAQCGELPLIQWVHDTKRHLLRVDYYAAVFKAFEVAAVRGDLNTVQWLVETFPSVVLDIGVLWLYEYAGEQCSPAAMLGAAKQCHVEVVKWLYEYCGLNCPMYAMLNAFALGDFDMLEFLHSTQKERFSVAAARTIATRHHQTEVLQWLTENYSEVR